MMKWQDSLFIDIAGYKLSQEDRAILKHPLVAGIVLFTRNYASIAQLKELTQSVHELKPTLQVAVDQEGGRVQRFQEQFTRIPAAAEFGQSYEAEPNNALASLRHISQVLAAELKAVGVDINFAPVLDLNWGGSQVIGARSFHQDPRIVATMATVVMQAMQQAGIVAVAKHFPGHGAALADSHVSLPIDERNAKQILQQDCQPFLHLIQQGLTAIMPAHVVYQSCDKKPATFSSYWLQTVLRQQFDFTGTVFSDDLSMAAAGSIGDSVTRVHAALTAGCDKVLICNDRAAVNIVLKQLETHSNE